MKLIKSSLAPTCYKKCKLGIEFSYYYPVLIIQDIINAIL